MADEKSENVRDKTVAFAAGYGTFPPAALQRIEELLQVNFFTFIGDDTRVPLRATTQEGLHDEIQGIAAPCNVVLQDVMGTELMACFLHSCSMVVSCTIADPNITRIGESVIARCSSLTSLDLSGMGAVTEIGDDFLDHCHSLIYLNMSGMGAVTRIGDGFLADCFSLTSLDMSGMEAIAVIGDRGFLQNCPSLSPCTRESLLLRGARKE